MDNKIDHQAFDNGLSALAKALGDNYVFHPDERKYDNYFASMKRTDNPHWELSFHAREYGFDGKVTASLVYPDPYRSYTPKEYYRSIQMSPTKNIKLMVRDIVERLLPEYDEMLADRVQRNEDTRLYNEKEAATKAMLFERGYLNRAFGSSNYEYTADAYRFGNCPKLTVQGGKVELDLGYLEAEKAMQVLDFLKGLY
jgi:hypothetical protein